MKLSLTLAAFAAFTGIGAEVRDVHVGDFYFQDQVSLTSTTQINVGDSVRWIWQSGSHTTTEVGKLWNASINSVTQQYTRVFDTPGVWEYFCTMDPLTMRGFVHVIGDQTSVPPSSVSVQPGQVVSGDLPEILHSDNQYLVGRPGIVLSGSSFPLVVTVSAQIPPGTAKNSLTFRIESRGTSGSILQRLRIYDPFQGVWVELGNALLTTSDTFREVTVNNPEQYMTPATGTVVAQAQYRVIAPVLTLPWEVRVDKIEFIAQ